MPVPTTPEGFYERNIRSIDKFYKVTKEGLENVVKSHIIRNPSPVMFNAWKVVQDVMRDFDKNFTTDDGGWKQKYRDYVSQKDKEIVDLFVSSGLWPTATTVTLD